MQGATLRCKLVTNGETYGVNVSASPASTVAPSNYHFVVDDRPSSG
ncbi:hypothetical protein [Mycobacterium tilburgii]|nr:hypothetical protein [Mycobacterium tilburgii]